jgi:hypothetical protein
MDSTGDYLMVDEAFPPQEHDADICLVYSGGDTPHAWSKTETDAQSATYRLPTWVRSNPTQVNVAGDIGGFLNWLKAVGAPKGSTVCLDLETAVDTAYVNAFNIGLTDAGYPVMKYGSRGFIFGNPKTSGGTFVADPTGQPHMVTEGDTVATQYLFSGNFDLSLVLKTVKLWNIKGSTPPPPPPPPPPGEVTITVTLPTLHEGESDSSGHWDIHTLQGLLCARNFPLTIDGIFGPGTTSKVKAFQGAEKITQDGIVGKTTWTKLVQP